MEANNMQQILDLQQAHFIKEGVPSYELRVDRLDRMKTLIMENRYKLVDALNEDFGVRSKNQSMATDVYTIIPGINYAKKNLKRWMSDSKRKPNFPLGLLGAKANVSYQPLGTVGMISPWNFPVYLTFAPLASIFAAGNQVMHKPSEYTEQTSNLLKELCDKAFDENEFATVLGGPDVGASFTQLKFDHLLYTGSGAVAKHIMKAAAENLVPVTLELGGKSPVIVSNTAESVTAAKRIMLGKTMNAGQICLAPDYVMVHSDKKDELVTEMKSAVSSFYPDLKHNDDYTSIINEKHYDRLQGLLQDAKAKGATIDEINPANEDFSQQEAFKIPPTLIMNPSDDMEIMQEEIFGPLLPIKEFTDIDETISYVNKNDKPLGLYYFGSDQSEESHVLSRTSSGGVTVNDVLGHIQQEDLPFGGVGPSGTGNYHGEEGFKNFSNPRAVYKQIGSRFDKLIAAIRPPYTGDIEKILKQIAK
ncbi:coniferyl aldehyde dehydrogenase [Gammaproteobacteria bacterium]|mgnify:FL=1|jgi:coniferyl-aldehyde dehydrogenase|nr:coniferyl aldehyde dehydrogenase [Gammaproteobacteria bacterium]